MYSKKRKRDSVNNQHKYHPIIITCCLPRNCKRKKESSQSKTQLSRIYCFHLIKMKNKPKQYQSPKNSSQQLSRKYWSRFRVTSIILDYFSEFIRKSKIYWRLMTRESCPSNNNFFSSSKNPLNNQRTLAQFMALMLSKNNGLRNHHTIVSYYYYWMAIRRDMIDNIRMKMYQYNWKMRNLSRNFWCMFWRYWYKMLCYSNQKMKSWIVKRT